MPFELPDLDDRRFDDLVAEARARLANHVPELDTSLATDPAVAFIDLFAFLTESICYRANLIPERQRRAFLNLLDLPLRPATAARGVLCVDSRGPELLPLLPRGTALAAGNVAVSTLTELEPMPLALTVMYKEPVSAQELADAGITPSDLEALHGSSVTPFRPRVLELPSTGLELRSCLDQSLYLALSVPTALASQLSGAELRARLLGKRLSLALAPPFDAITDEALSERAPRRLELDVAYEQNQRVRYAPLSQTDGSGGLQRAGVLRVQLPASAELLTPPAQDDPQYAGVGDAPPELPTTVRAESLVCWLRLRCPEDAQLAFSYLGINGVEVAAQGVVDRRRVAVGTGEPNQTIELGHTAIERDSFELTLGDGSQTNRWTQVEHLATSARPSAREVVLDAAAGVLRFGNGINAMRPAAGSSIRVSYRHGGGELGNLLPRKITGLSAGGGRHVVRQELPLRGGADAESVFEAEQRIGEFLRHRGRAVTLDDFRALALELPSARVARAEVVPGMVPIPSSSLVRTQLPGAVSVFVMPARPPALAAPPRPSVGMLRDVYAYLRARSLIGTELYVLSPEFKPLALTVCCGVRDAERERETLAEVEHALLTYLWSLAPGGPRAEGWPLGYAVEPNELAVVVARVPNVLRVGTIALYRLQGEAWTDVPAGTALALPSYALPELRAVSVLSDPSAPAVLPPALQGPPAGTQAVPAPIIPERC